MRRALPALLPAIWLVFGACGDDPARPAATSDGDLAGQDGSGELDDGGGSTDDVGPDPGGPEAGGPEAGGPDDVTGDAIWYDPPETGEWACNAAIRVAECDSELLHDGAPMPTDGADPLFYVNREYAIPADFPISPTSKWIPCYGGDPGVENDLVCLPDAYSTKSLALRQLAWYSPAPAEPELSYDGKEIGFEGMVGFKAMFDAAMAEVGAELRVASGYRSYATQDSLFYGYVASTMAGGMSEEDATVKVSTYSAMPGHSEHQLGTTGDLVYRKDNGSMSGFGQSSSWEMYNSWQMGWVQENAHRFGVVLTYGPDKVAATQYVWEPWHWRFVGVQAANDMRRCDLNTEEFLGARYGEGELPWYAGYPLILWDDMAVDYTAEPGIIEAEPGEALSRTWVVTNMGRINWAGYAMVRTEGEALLIDGPEEVEVPCTPVFEDVELEVPLIAPSEPGYYESTWRLISPEGRYVPGELLAQVFVPGAGEGGEYRFVRIDDLSGVTSGNDPGADIDAVVLEASDDAVPPAFALAVAHYEAKPGTVSHGNAADALGEPDAFYDWPDDVSVCGVSGGFVSLGGAGTIIVQMERPIREGDAITVLEVGACSYGGAQDAFADEFAVQVSVGSATGDVWVPVGDSPGGPDTLIVPTLPPLPSR